MKILVQIPCLNEEKTLPVTLAGLPRTLPGGLRVEVLVVDDGSSDRTVEVARSLGVDHLVSLPSHQGLARAFMKGLETSLRLGADIIVNTDADNQYDTKALETLIQPILAGRADIVVGDRRVAGIPHFSRLKRLLHRTGNRVMGGLAGIELRDSTSGFRAFSREAALRLNTFSKFTYTLETLIQAGKKDLALVHVPVGVNEKLRESRLFPNLWFYVKRSASTMVRIYAMYEPLKFFSYLGALVIGAGAVFLLRILYYYLTREGPTGHVQSLLAGVTLLGIGVFIVLIGVVSDLIASNRRLLEDVQYRVRRLELEIDKPRRGTRGEETVTAGRPGRHEP